MLMPICLTVVLRLSNALTTAGELFGMSTLFVVKPCG